MGNLAKLRKDVENRRIFMKKEIKILVFKYNVFDLNNREKKFFLYKFAQLFHLNWSRSRLVNRCVLTGRSRWVISRYRLSRIMFKNMCDNGDVHGVRRSSW